MFIPLYREHADKSGFPDFEPLLRRLGVDVEDGIVLLSNGAEFAGIRRAITGN